MTAIQRTLGRRLVMQRGLRLAGWGVLVLAGLAAVALVVAQALGVVVPGVWYGWAAGGVLAVALVLGRWKPTAAAARWRSTCTMTPRPWRGG